MNMELIDNLRWELSMEELEPWRVNIDERFEVLSVKGKNIIRWHLEGKGESGGCFLYKHYAL